MERSQPEKLLLDRGTVVTVPPYEPHNYINLCGHPAKMMVVLDKQMIELFYPYWTKRKTTTNSIFQVTNITHYME